MASFYFTQFSISAFFISNYRTILDHSSILNIFSCRIQTPKWSWFSVEEEFNKPSSKFLSIQRHISHQVYSQIKINLDSQA